MLDAFDDLLGFDSFDDVFGLDDTDSFDDIDSWHTRAERRAIADLGGTPLVQYGVDGELDGRPVEHRIARKDDRYRIQRDTHRELVREGGSYIFGADGRRRVVPAREVSELIGRGKWYHDRDYPHKFASVDDVFRR